MIDEVEIKNKIEKMENTTKFDGGQCTYATKEAISGKGRFDKEVLEQGWFNTPSNLRDNLEELKPDKTIIIPPKED